MVEDVQEYIDGVPESQQEIIEAVRALIGELAPDAAETIKWNQPVYVVDGENRLYVAAQRDHVNLGFMQGASMDDPDGVLEGTGKKMRHVKLSDPSEVDTPAIRRLVETAVQ